MTKTPTSAAVQLARRKNSDKWQERRGCFVFKKVTTVPSLALIFILFVQVSPQFPRFYGEIQK